jgi:adenylylsulfate kinase
MKGFTGIDDPYEAPEHPEIALRTDRLSIADSVAELLGALESRGLLEA